MNNKIILVPGVRAVFLERILSVKFATANALAQNSSRNLSLIRHLTDLVIELLLRKFRPEKLVSRCHKLKARLALESFKRVNADFSSTGFLRAINDMSLLLAVAFGFCKPRGLMSKNVVATVLNFLLTSRLVK